MSAQPSQDFNFSKIVPQLRGDDLWEYDCGSRGRCESVADEVFQTLQRPSDFPPIGAAIVSGDRVAIALDPNTPQVSEVLQGVLNAVRETEATDIDVVLGDEATDETLGEVQRVAGEVVRVIRHEPSDRESLRYLGADAAAHPIYLNRALVDADFVLPVVVGRPKDESGLLDGTGIFPFYSDACSRARFFQSDEPSDDAPSDPSEPAWLLGVQIMLSVTPNNEGVTGEVTAGTAEAIGKLRRTARRAPDGFPPPAKLVIASLDGSTQQQTWQNAARGIAAAARYCEPSGTIVLWSQIKEEPVHSLNGLSEGVRLVHESMPPAEGEFPSWDPSINPAHTFARIGNDYRILVHASIEGELIEAMGLGWIENVEELVNLTATHDSCGVLRAAQFAGDAVDALPRTP